MRARFADFLDARPARAVFRYRDFQLGGAELGEFRGHGIEHHREARQALGELGALGEHDAPFDRHILRDGLDAGDAVIESGLRIREGAAARAFDQRPVGHLVAAEHIADDVAHVDDHHAAAGEQHEVEVIVAAVAVGHQHVAQEVGGTAGHARDAARITAAQHPGAPAEKAEQRHARLRRTRSWRTGSG